MENENIIFIPEEDQPYSDIVVVQDKFLFLSGLVSEELSTRDEAYGTIEFETNRILDNLNISSLSFALDSANVQPSLIITAAPVSLVDEPPFLLGIPQIVSTV